MELNYEPRIKPLIYGCNWLVFNFAIHLFFRAYLNAPINDRLLQGTSLLIIAFNLRDSFLKRFRFLQNRNLGKKFRYLKS